MPDFETGLKIVNNAYTLRERNRRARAYSDSVSATEVDYEKIANVTGVIAVIGIYAWMFLSVKGGI